MILAFAVLFETEPPFPLREMQETKKAHPETNSLLSITVTKVQAVVSRFPLRFSSKLVPVEAAHPTRLMISKFQIAPSSQTGNICRQGSAGTTEI